MLNKKNSHTSNPNKIGQEKKPTTDEAKKRTHQKCILSRISMVLGVFFSFMESSLLICFEYYDYYFINILTFFGAYRESKQLTKRRKRCGQPKPQKRRKDDNEKEFVNKYKIHSKDKKNNQQQ